MGALGAGPTQTAINATSTISERPWQANGLMRELYVTSAVPAERADSLAEGAAARAITRWPWRGAGDCVERTAFVGGTSPNQRNEPPNHRPPQQQIHQENAGEGVFAVGDD